MIEQDRIRVRADDLGRVAQVERQNLDRVQSSLA